MGAVCQVIGIVGILHFFNQGFMGLEELLVRFDSAVRKLIDIDGCPCHKGVK